MDQSSGSLLDSKTRPWAQSSTNILSLIYTDFPYFTGQPYKLSYNCQGRPNLLNFTNNIFPNLDNLTNWATTVRVDQIHLTLPIRMMNDVPKHISISRIPWGQQKVYNLSNLRMTIKWHPQLEGLSLLYCLYIFVPELDKFRNLWFMTIVASMT